MTIIINSKKNRISISTSILAIFILFSVIIIILSTSVSSATLDSTLDSNQDQPQTRAVKPPGLEISKSVNRPRIFVSTSGVTPMTATVTLTVKGVGYPGVEFNPQDTVFIMDNSDSMDENDNEFKRVEAVKLYLDTMIPPDDRAAIVKFSNNAELVNTHHLTSNYTQLVMDLEALWQTTGLTNLGAAVALANQELIEHGDGENKTLVEILLTDGRAEPPIFNVTQETISEAKDHNIKIYTVGLGEDHDADLLKWISKQTDGKYYYAKNASELFKVYNEISNQFRNYTAASDADLADPEPMVRDIISKYFNYVNGSSTISPDYIGPYPNIGTKLEWNIDKIMIGETWSVSYNISSDELGENAISVQGLSRVRFLNQAEKNIELPFDHLTIIVLKDRWFGVAPPPPPPPPPPPTPPPVSGFPVPAAPATTPVPLAMQPAVPVTAGAATTQIPIYLSGGFIGLGLAGMIKQKRSMRSRQKVAIGV